jgi:CO/xanthine dehydrogenase Mo-binding subunit
MFALAHGWLVYLQCAGSAPRQPRWPTKATHRLREFAIGQSVLRREDPRLLRGQGRFFDDLKLADQLYVAIVRSPHAHADITGIDTRAALQMPGVHAVLTGADYRGDGLGSLPSMAAYQRRGGPMFLPPRPAIASDRVMHIGYPVAVVVADALEQARATFPQCPSTLQRQATSVTRPDSAPRS